MPQRFANQSTQATKDAVWLDWSAGSRARGLAPSHPAFRPFRELGVRALGEDILKERFFAGTPCSPTHLLWVVTRGRISMDFGEGPVVIENGRMALCPAMRPHWVRLVSKSARGLWFHFHRLPRWQHLSNAGPGIHDTKHAAELEWLLTHCLGECASTDFGANPNALHYAEILAVVLERELAVFGPRPNEQALVTRLETLWAEVIENPGNRWSVAEIARMTGTSTRELHRMCANLYGIGPMGVVTRARMDRAMELLITTERKIADVAHEVGYSTAHAFSEAFLTHVGKRPGSFRNKLRNQTTEPSP